MKKRKTELERLRREWSQVYAANEQLIREVERAEWQNAKLLVSEARLRRIEEAAKRYLETADEHDLRLSLEGEA